jgi:hypothetical protein
MDEHAYGSSERIGVRLPARERGRARLLADVPALGVVALGSIASLATAAALLGTNRPSSYVVWFLAAAAALAALAIGVLAWSVSSTGERSRPDSLLRALERPVGGWLCFLSGCLLALPVVSLYSRALAGDSDSGRLLASILYVQREGVDRLTETQEVFLPHALLGPIVALGDIPWLQAFNVLSVLALTGVVAFLGWRLTGSFVGALSSALALTALGSILERAYKVPMYPTMLALGFLGLYLSYRAMTEEKRARRWLAAALAGICLIGSMEAHQVGQLFVLLSALLLVAYPSRRALSGLGRVYLCTALLYIPRALVNLADGGLSHFFQNRVDYWVTEGYLRSIQVEMFDYPRSLSLGEYLSELPGGFLGAWGATGGLTLALGAASIFFAPARLRRFIIASGLVLMVVLVGLRIPFFSRYFSLLLVGSALAAGLTIAALMRRQTFRWHAAAALALLGLVVANAFNYHLRLDRLHDMKTVDQYAIYRQLAREIAPGEGVIGTRSFNVNNASTGPRVYGGDFLSESEYVTFLTWPSDDAVIDLMRRHDAQWVFVPDMPWRWVGNYNDHWLGPAYGEEARYHREVRRSPNFCLERRINFAALYRLDPGGPRRAGARGPNWCAD